MSFEAESLRRFPGAAPVIPSIALAGFTDDDAAQLRDLLGGSGRVVTVRSAPSGNDAAVLCLGPLLSPLEARHLVTETHNAHVLLTAAGPDPAMFQDLIDADRLFYVSTGALRLRDLAALVLAAIERRGTAAASKEPTAGLRQAANAARRVAAQSDLASAGASLQVAVAETIDADRVYCLLHDEAGEVLWSRADGPYGDERRESSAVGLVSFVARTRRALRLRRASSDPRFERAADDPLGEHCEHLLALPICAPEPDAPVLAVLCAVRDRERAAFSAADETALTLFASTVAPSLELAMRIDTEIRRDDATARGRSAAIFREEAIEHHVAGAREGDWLRLSPRWTRTTSWLLLALVAAFVAFAAFSTIDEHSSGPAIVRLSGRTEVAASQAGMIAAVDVRSGQRVSRGDVVVRFQSAREAADLARIAREWDLQLVERLRDLSAAAPAQALITLRAERDLALARLDERVVRAPASGVIRDVRCRPGQQVAPGDILVSLGTTNARPALTALLPGEHLPLLRPGMPLNLKLRGYADAPQHLTIASVSDEVVGPEEARRLLGPEVATAVPLNGALVRVEAFFPSDTFDAAGEHYGLHDGMWGTADVAVRSESLLVTLVPGLRAIAEHRR